MILNPDEDIICELCKRGLSGRYWRLQSPSLMPQSATHTLTVCVGCYKICHIINRMLKFGILKRGWEELEMKKDDKNNKLNT